MRDVCQSGTDKNLASDLALQCESVSQKMEHLISIKRIARLIPISDPEVELETFYLSKKRI